MAIGMFIEYNNQIVQFPVNPATLELIRDANNNTTEIVELGEINRLGITNLATCVIESFFPSHSQHSFVNTQGGFQLPNFYINFLNRIMNDRRPCRFIVTDTKVNMMASIESFDFEYRAGEVGDVYYKLNLKEFRSHAARRVTVDLTGQIPTMAPRPAPAPQRPTPNPRVTRGARVIANGRLHRDSFGTGPGQTERNAVRVVNIIAPGRSHPYHVALVGGGNRGWMRAQDVRVQT